MVPEFVQLYGAILLVLAAVAPLSWVRLRPGLSLARRMVVIVTSILLRLGGFVVSYAIILRLAGDEIDPMLAQAGAWPVVDWGRRILVEGGLPLAAAIGTGLGLAAVRAALSWRRTTRNGDLLGFVMWEVTRSAPTPITRFLRPPETTSAAAELPRTIAEMIIGGVVGSVVVGVTEELLFRVGLPALVLQTSGNLWLSLSFSLAVFAVLHAYQGWKGIANSVMLGTVFTYVYLTTGSIVLPIILHVVNNVFALVVLPVVGWGAARRQFDERMRGAERRAAGLLRQSDGR